MSTVTITPSAEPQMPDATQMSEAQAFAIPLDELKKAAGIGQPQIAEQAPVQQQTAQHPAHATAEKFTFSQDDNGVTITLSPEYGGEVYKGKDLAEVVNRIASVNADKNAYIKQLKANPQQPQQQPQEPHIDPAALAAAHEILAPEQQAAAQQEAVDFLRGLIITPEVKQQIVSEALGVADPRFLPQITGQIVESHNHAQMVTTQMDFHQLCPTYLDTPENSQALASYFPDNFVQQTGRLPNAGELKQAFAMAILEGKITPHDPKAVAPPAPRPPVMPSAVGSTASQSGGDPWTMPLDQLAQLAGIK